QQAASVRHPQTDSLRYKITMLPRLDFERAQPVLVKIVTVHRRERQCAVAVASPAAAQVNRIVNAPDLVIAAEAQSDGVIFAIARIRQAGFSQYRHVKGSWRAQPVDAQRVVAPVLPRPFAVVNQSR